MTICIHNHNTDPAFNLAAEEHLLLSAEEAVFMLWRNEPAIVIGRNQNAYAEINLPFIEEEGIQVIRRLSGGGAVFHDLGNVNFTFIVTQPGGPKIDFQRYTDPIIDALTEFGVHARFEGRNDLTVGGRKISGNAQHIHRDRVLHHGTLLYASQLSKLTEALKVNEAKFEDKAVKSVRSRVTNIIEHMDQPVEIEVFMERFMDHMISRLEDARRYSWTEQDLEAIEHLRQEKYGNWDWNIGRSPDYGLRQTRRTPGGTVDIQLDVEEGVIQDLRIFGDFFGVRDIGELEAALRGVKHKREAIERHLEGFDLGEYLQGIPRATLVDCFF